MGSIHTSVWEDLAPDRQAFFRQHGFLRSPQLVQWLITSRCSLRCGHCLSAGFQQDVWLDRHRVDDLAMQLAAMGVAEVLLTGGEPLEHPDFEGVVHSLHQHGLAWSLNTATAPSPSQWTAIASWPPRFVAVSIDGPATFHNAFRGSDLAFANAMGAIQSFRALADCQVAAGTTITRANFPLLAETFLRVATSGAHSWGLHLVVAEGRASHRTDMTLTAPEIRELIRFAASKRAHFPVSMADEVGYCGGWDPLVRDQPFFCGAGRAQCVILPTGDVVACTTSDLRESAGNLLTAPLSSIWRDGFAAQRNPTHDQRCASCVYLPACGAGCWLQRRHGTQCMKAAWARPAPKGRWGLAVCLGLAACAKEGAPPIPPGPVASVRSQPSASAAPAPSAPDPLPSPSASASPAPEHPAVDHGGIDQSIVWWSVQSPSSVCGEDAMQAFGKEVEALQGDALGTYLRSLATAPCPVDLPTRSRQVSDALATHKKSLTVAALLWRDLSETCLDTPVDHRTAQERGMIRDAFRALGRAATAWRLASFDGKLDPFLFRDPSDIQHFMRSKAGPPPQIVAWTVVDQKRWGSRTPAITRAYLDQHPVAEAMQLPIEQGTCTGCKLATQQATRALQARDRMGVFDTLITPKGGSAITLQVVAASTRLPVVLPPDTELSYIDICKAAYDQHASHLDAAAQQSPSISPDGLAIPPLRAWAATVPFTGRRGSHGLRLAAAWLF